MRDWKWRSLSTFWALVGALKVIHLVDGPAFLPVQALAAGLELVIAALTWFPCTRTFGVLGTMFLLLTFIVYHAIEGPISCNCLGNLQINSSAIQVLVAIQSVLVGVCLGVIDRKRRAKSTEAAAALLFLLAPFLVVALSMMTQEPEKPT